MDKFGPWEILLVIAVALIFAALLAVIIFFIVRKSKRDKDIPKHDE